MTAATIPHDGSDAALAAEYVLRLLNPNEEHEVERRLLEDRVFEAEVGRWVQHFAPMADEFTEMRPRRKVRRTLMQSLFDHPAQARSVWDMVGLWRGVSLASVAALAVTVGVTFTAPPDTPFTGPVVSGPVLVSEIVAEDGALRVLAVYDGDTGQLRLNRTDGGAIAGRVLQLWAIAEGAAPVSLGVLPPETSTLVSVPETLRAGVASLILAVSDEPLGGSPTGAPTGAVLAAGTVAEI